MIQVPRVPKVDDVTAEVVIHENEKNVERDEMVEEAMGQDDVMELKEYVAGSKGFEVTEEVSNWLKNAQNHI